MTEQNKSEVRTIPGLGSLTSGGASKTSKRSRPKTSSKPPATAAAASEEAPAAPVPQQQQQQHKEKPTKLHLNPEALLVPQEDASADLPPKVPASTIVAKRVKLLQKKLQRIQGYADSTAALNEDQKRAVQSKPSLESTVKELQDVVKLLEQDEAEQEKHQATRNAQDDKRVQAKVSLAVHESQKQAQSDLVMLLQFFHLSNLFSPDQGFNPPVLPAVVQNATGQEMAAVKTLQEAFINGPLMGGGDDAFERLIKLAKSDESDIVEGVSYGRVKQMILDLSAAPGEVAPDHASAAGGEDAPFLNGQAHVTADERAAAEEAQSQVQAAPAPGLSFMQASELEEPQSQPAPPSAPAVADHSPWNEAPPPPAAAAAAAAAANTTALWNQPPPQGQPQPPPQGQPQPPTRDAIRSLDGANQPESWGAINDPAEAVSSWADDVEQARAPPAAAAAAAPAVPLDSSTTAAAGDAAAEDKPAAQQQQQQQQHQRGRGRGGQRGPRGEGQGRGRGGHRNRGGARNGGAGANGGGPQAGEGDDWVKVGPEPRNAGGQQGQRGRGRGGSSGQRGGRGRGGPRGEGRPQQQQQQQQSAVAPQA